MEELHDFFVASVGAAAALIGLLFVAITLSPEKFFGDVADRHRRGQATGAFIALANVLFVSLTALNPGDGGRAILIVAIASFYQTLREGTIMQRLFPELSGLHRYGLVSMGIYLLELGFAARFVLHWGNAEGLVYTVLGLYGYALFGAWKLLGRAGKTEP